MSALVLATITTACAGGGDGTANGSEVTLGTVPDPEVAADSSPELDNSGDSEPAAPSTEPPSSDAATTNDSTTTVLTPSPEADLPTQATPTEAAPVTTLPGPLPQPAVRLIEIATFEQPVEATGANFDTRLFIVQNGGTVIAVDDESNTMVFDVATVDATTFTDDGNEQGLLGLAFHPKLDVAYVNYTNAGGNTVIAEFAHDPVTFEFDPASFREVLTVDQPSSTHNGGELVFGPDGLLYIGTGDGGSADDPNRSALDLSSRLGKILRIDPVATDDGPFTVPADNPFIGVEGADPAVWSLGLRNPWRFSFDSLTGDLWISDVGQNIWEEVDLAPATDGLNAGQGISFGWSAFEAADRFNDDQSPDGHTLPVASYIHEDGNCSISGGVVARDSSYGDLNGWYVYGDYCSGRVWALDTTSVASTPSGPVGEPKIVEIAVVPGLSAVVEGPFGDIYALSVNGPVYRLAPA
jgi:glucose/arabinose dehydrogenase